MLVKNRRLGDSSSTTIVLYSCSIVDSVGLHRTSREKVNPGGSWTFCVSHGSTACLHATDLERDRVSRKPGIPKSRCTRQIVRFCGWGAFCGALLPGRADLAQSALLPYTPVLEVTLDCPRSPNADRRRGRRARRRGGLGGACHVLVRGARQIDQTHQCDDQGRVGTGRAYTAAAGGHVLHR